MLGILYFMILALGLRGSAESSGEKFDFIEQTSQALAKLNGSSSPQDDMNDGSKVVLCAWRQTFSPFAPKVAR